MGKRKPLDPGKIKPATLWIDAKHYRKAAEGLIAMAADAASRGDEGGVRQLLRPTWLVICTSMELGFKAYLNRQGFTLERLKWDVGHNLHQLQQDVLEQAEPDGELAWIVSRMKPAIGLLNEPYMDKRFVYRQIGVARYPKEQAVVCRLLEVFQGAIKPLVNLPVEGDGPEAEGIHPA